MKASAPALDLPPAYTLVTLRESGDAHRHAESIAAREGAGTLVWTRRFDLAECAVVLEPELPLTEARHVVFAGQNALAAALSTHAPPEREITFDWPDSVAIDGVGVGGVRLGAPANCAETGVPDWLVLSMMVRTTLVAADDPGFRPLLGALDETGFEDISPADLVASFARHLMRELDLCEHAGMDEAYSRYAARLRTPPDGRPLGEALASASWLDPATGMPRC